jgi:putative endonuclease
VDPRQTLGVLGEEVAFHYLRSRGYRVLLRNYRCLFGEIDLVACDGDVLVFVEVKTRTDDSMGAPAEAVTAHKRRQITRSANHYLKSRGQTEATCRFDVVSVLLPPAREPEISLIAGAFVEGE